MVVSTEDHGDDRINEGLITNKVPVGEQDKSSLDKETRGAGERKKWGEQ